jgi:Mrp family chromosome partitioning ATPase
LRQVLLLREQGEPLPCLLVTSPWAGDGKTTTAHALAALTYTMGNSCIVVECHRGEGHEILRGPQETGWIQHLEDGKPLDDIVEAHPEGGFDILPAGRTTERAYDLQASKAFADLVTQLKARYDTIIVDAPAILDDMRLFAHPEIYDYVLMMVRANTTPKNALTYAVRRVAEAGLSDFGAVLTMVDMRDYERRESGEYRAALDRPGRKLPKQKSGRMTSLGSIASKLLPFAGGVLAVLGVAAMLAERLIALPPE